MLTVANDRHVDYMFTGANHRPFYFAGLRDDVMSLDSVDMHRSLEVM